MNYLLSLLAISLFLIGCGKEEKKEGTPINQVNVAAPEVTSVVPAVPSNNNSPVVSGTAPGLVLVKLYSDSTCATQIGIGNSIADGTFSITASVADNSTTTIYATAHNGSYSSSCSTTYVTYVEDSGVPSAITFTGTDPVSPAESTTAKISGTAEANSTVKLYTNATCSGAPAYTGTANGSGNFEIDISVTLNTTTTFWGLSTDGAGNSSACSSTSVVYESRDMTAPVRPVVVSINPVGPSNNNNPIVSGTAEAGSTVRFFTNATCSSGVVGTGTADGSGNFAVTLSATSNTTRNYYANARDSQNNTSPCSTTFVSYTEDSTAPAVPTFNATNPVSPSESFNATISGSTEANAIVKLYTTSNCTGAVAHDLIANGSGGFSVDITVAPGTTTTYYGRSTDAAGNNSACSPTPVTYTQADLTPPLMPVISGITPIGPSDINTPQITGTAEAGATIQVYTANDCSGTSVGSGTVGATGDFTVGANSVDNTTTTYYVTAVDANNNASPCSSTSVSYTSYSIPEGMAWFTGATTTTAPSTNTNINQATAYSLRWTMSEYHSTYFNHSRTTNPHQITAIVTGDYLLNLTIPYTSSTTNTSVRAEVRVNGTVVDIGRTESGYISNASSAHRDSSLHLTTLLSLNANDVVDVTVIRTGAAATATISGTATLGIEHIESTRNIFFAKSDRTTNSTNLNQSTAYPIQWTNTISDGIYAHNNFSNSQNITINSTGHYLAAINIPLESAIAQANVKLIIKLNGVALNYGIASQGIIRGTTHLASSVHWFGLLPNIPSGTVVTVETVAEATTGSVVTPAGRMASIYLEQVSSAGLFFTRGSTLVTNNNWNNSTTGQSVRWTTDVALDSSQYSHSTSTNPHQVTLLQAGDYMLMMNNPTSSSTAGTNVISRVRIDAAAVSGAESKTSYISATGSHNETSNALMFLLRKRAANQVLDVIAVREANAGTVSSNGDSILLLRYRPNSVTP